MDWINEIGILGGIAGFYSSIIVVIVGYFADIDYHVTAIEKLFLYELSDEKFFNRFLNPDGKNEEQNWC